MSVFVRQFECENKPVVVTFTPTGNGLLAVTAEMEGRPLTVKASVGVRTDPTTGAILLKDQHHLRPSRYPSPLKLYKRPTGIYSHDIRSSGGHADFSSESATDFEMNAEMTELTISDSFSLDGQGGPP